MTIDAKPTNKAVNTDHNSITVDGGSISRTRSPPETTQLPFVDSHGGKSKALREKI
jgi:hypothetical protein